MKTTLKWAARILVMLVLAAAVVFIWKREEITRLMAVNSLFAQDRIVWNFSNMDQLFLNRPVPLGDSTPTELPIGPTATLPAGTDAWITQRALTSLVVLKDGAIVHEDYYQGTTPEDLRISWSMAKSYLSALFGILLEDGTIASLQDPVTKYAPALKGTAYDGATLQNVLQMSSGVTFDEDYLDKSSDINRMGRVLALGGTMDGFAAGLTETFVAPGAQWQYVSIDTHVLGMVIRGATGQDVPTLLSEKIMSKLGLEAEPYYVTDGEGVAFVLGGLNIRSRDYARFGQMIAQNGVWQGTQIVPANWIAESTTASAPTAEGDIGYGYQWWVPIGAKPGEFLARGVYGQYIYIDQSENVVIVSTAADRAFRDEEAHPSNVAQFRAITKALSQL